MLNPGFIAVPILHSFKNQGLFDHLSSHEDVPVSMLCSVMKANAGHFLVAMEFLAHLGILQIDEEENCRSLVPLSNSILGEDISAFYAPDIHASLSSIFQSAYISKIADRSGFADEIDKLVYEAIINIVLIGIKEIGLQEFSSIVDNMPDPVAETISRWLLEKENILDSKWKLGLKGKAQIASETLNEISCIRPVLGMMDDLLFGNPSRAVEIVKRFSRDDAAAVLTGDDIHAGEIYGEYIHSKLDEIVGRVSSIQSVDSLYFNAFFPLHRWGKAKTSKNKSLEVVVDDLPDFYIDVQGRKLEAIAVVNAWERYLADYSECVAESRMLCVVPHCLPRGFSCLDSELYCLNTLRLFVGTHLISAETFIVLAANVGLFNREQPFRHPRESNHCSLSLHNFEKREYIVRHARLKDLGRLKELEDKCWHHTKSTKQQIRSRIVDYPQGQFVLEKDRKVLGVVYSQRVTDVNDLDKKNAHNVHELHSNTGSVIQLLAVNIDPEIQNLGYGDQLLEFMLQRCSFVYGVKQVIGVTLCKKYDSETDENFESYIKFTGDKLDPVLAFHCSHGAAIVKSIPNYRPEDKANNGFGVLVSYDILKRKVKTEDLLNRDVSSDEASLLTNGKDGVLQAEVYDSIAVRQFLYEKARQLLGSSKNEFDPHRPLMEMGLDSADLLKFQVTIESEYKRKFPAGFFFQHNTISKVENHLRAELGCTESKNKYKAIESLVDGGLDAKSGIDISHTGNLELNLKSSYREEDIAVIGMSCRLPGGIDNSAQLWEVLAAGKCMIDSYPEKRGAWPSHNELSGIHLGGFIQDADLFDAAFFRISPAEAQIIDPQQRILLELSWRCLEDACLPSDKIKGGNAGVFIGASNCDYSRVTQDARLNTQAHHATGSSLAVLANRISYFYDLSGPSMLIDTACSASLVALHTAVRAIRRGECALAFVGGVNFICHADLSIAYHKAGMLAPDGRCKVFDADANGYVRSEGACMVLLKSLKNALAENDRIHAVIKGSAINHGGLAGGLTVPNPQKQAELIAEAWKDAAVRGCDISYIEAHGTGTPLGDPIEIQGIQTANILLDEGYQISQCGIGSIKSNLGHLESAAGITGLLKVILSLQKKALPPSINYVRLNPKISLANTPFYITSSYQQWNTEGKRIAGVSSFGSGGANAHVVVAEWDATKVNNVESKILLFTLSARNSNTLKTYAGLVLKWLDRAESEIRFIDFLYSFQVGRTAMEERLAIHTTDFGDLKVKLEAWIESGETSENVWQANTTKAQEKFDTLLPGERAEEIFQQALSKKSAIQIAKLWTLGFNLDFSRIYEETPGKIFLPGYPLARNKYWINTQNGNEVDPVVGVGKRTDSGNSFVKVWETFPEKYTFKQGNFSCLSLGFILEAFVISGCKTTNSKMVSAINKLKYYPFSIENSLSTQLETRCFSAGNVTTVELIEIVGKDEYLIAEAELFFENLQTKYIPLSRKNATYEFIRSLEDSAGALPIDSINKIFPALISGKVTSEVFLPRILIYPSSISSRSMLIAIDSEEISILNDSKEAVLTIANNMAG